MGGLSLRGIGFGVIVMGAGGRYPHAECGLFVLKWTRHFLSPFQFNSVISSGSEKACHFRLVFEIHRPCA